MTSILDPDRHRFDRSAYERPNYKYRCGRAASWGKPCMRGPNIDGSCGGVTVCSPVKNQSSRFECRRPATAGGPCEQGPQSDGSCSIVQPPCSPRRSLRSIRGRLALLALGLVLAFIGGSMGPIDNSIPGINWTIPGPLTSVHAKITGGSGCKLCHENHNSGGANWIKAVFTPANVTAQCTNCHSFDGSARLAHNRENPDRPDLGKTTCLMCHTEHKGVAANIVKHSDFQCASCHEKKFSNFSRGHPEFPARFPYDSRTAIKFDHGSHFGKHFTDARYADRVPTTCLSCHSQDPNKQSLVRAGFENNCAACHGDQMADRELVVLRLPEFTDNTIDRDSLIDACGLTSDEIEALEEVEDEDDEFESISSEEKSVIGAYLLNVSADSPDEYTEPMQELVLAMAEGGIGPLAELIDERAENSISAKLLAGLNPETIKRLACSWAANLEYELPAEASMGGWYGDFLELRYRPVGHGDAISKDWIEFGLAAAQSAENDDLGERATAMRDSLIDPKQGVGACAKCHSVNAANDDENVLNVGWRARDVMSSGRNFNFTHNDHLNLFDAKKTSVDQADQGCRVCHILDPQADFAGGFSDFDPQTYASNFIAIDKEVCTDCHSTENVQQSCQLCHDYHRGAVFQTRNSWKETPPPS